MNTFHLLIINIVHTRNTKFFFEQSEKNVYMNID